MAEVCSVRTAEREKFVLTKDDEVAIRSVLSNGFLPEQFDDIQITYTDGLMTQVDYYCDAVLVRSLGLTYNTDDCIERVQVL